MSEPTERLIFDRTQQDVLDDTEKGQYNVSDLNRVEIWCRYLADKLTAYGYAVNITTKTNWTQFDKRKASEMERIRSNIRRIMEGYHYLTSIEPNAEFFNYVKANNWEKILDEINMLMQSMSQYFVYSGVANAGQPRLWQNRFRHSYTPYTTISHIESTGTQWIDTGIQSQVNIKVQMLMELTDILSDNDIFGNEASGATLLCVRTAEFGGWSLRQDLNVIESDVDASINTTYFIDANWTDSNCSLKINGTELISSSTGNTNTGDINLKIFSTGASYPQNANMKLYWCKMFLDDKLVRNYIPVLDDNNVACLYDTITDGLFYNAGTGNFNY